MKNNGKLSSKTKKIYTIKLADWLFHDPKFSKKSSTYVAISNAFLNSKTTDSMSLGQFKLMISFIQEATKLGRTTIKVNEKFCRSQGKVTEKSLLELNDFGYLELLVSKEERELDSSSKEVVLNDQLKVQPNAEQLDNNNNAESLIKSSDVKKSQKPNHVQSFDDRFALAEYLTELQELKLDHPIFKNNLRLIHERFKTAQAFTEFILSTCENKTYKALKAKGDSVSCDKYLTKTLKAEMGIV